MKFLSLFLAFTLLLHYSGNSSAAEIERVDDTDLVHLLTGEDNVIVLFRGDDTDVLENLEKTLLSIKDDLKDTLSAAIVKIYGSQLLRIYNPSMKTSLVSFRSGIPLLYHGEINGDEILDFLINNREPVVKELADINFEHLTQASSGSTTGDWFIFFYSADCILCQRLYAVWEGVGAKLKRNLNVARVNRLDGGEQTAKRFKITDSPQFILIRQGKYFPYVSKDYNIGSFIDFVTSGYKNVKEPQTVPPLPDLLDAQLEPVIAFLKAYYIYAVLLCAVVLVIFKIKQKPTAVASKKTK